MCPKKRTASKIPGKNGSGAKELLKKDVSGHNNNTGSGKMQAENSPDQGDVPQSVRRKTGRTTRSCGVSDLPAKRTKIRKKFCGKGRKILTGTFSFAIITNCVDCITTGVVRASAEDILPELILEERRKTMPTFNQLVRKGREKVTYKSTSPALQLRREASAPQSVPLPRRSRTPLCVRSPVSVSRTAMRSPLTSPVSATTCRSTLW